MNPVEAGLRRVDRLQQEHRILAFGFAVNKKFGDDQAGNLAALLTYYGFLSIFPLMLVLVTLLGLLSGPHARLTHRILHAVTEQFPVLGNQLHIGSLHRNGALGLAIGLGGLLWGTLGSVQNGQYAMAQIWNIPQVDRPGFLPRLVRSAAVLVLMVVFLTVSAGLAGVTTFSGSQAALWRILGVVVSLVVDAGFMVMVFRALTPKEIATTHLVLGAAIAGVAWTALQITGTFLVGHELKNLRNVYGTFAVVLGLLWWIFLGARTVLYAAELNVVRARHLWPRSLVQPPLTEADRQMLVTYAEQERRRPEVGVTAEIGTTVAGEPAKPPAD